MQLLTQIKLDNGVFLKLRIITLTFSVLLLTGCTSYRVSDGRVEYVSWNEAQGKVVTPIPLADAATFKELNKFFGVDKSHSYFKALVIQGANASSFEILDGFYSRDIKHAYRRHILIQDSDAKSFEVLGHGFSKDRNNYYFGETKIPVCDYDTFSIIDEYLPSRAIDKDCYYYEGEKIDMNNRNSLEVLPKYYARTSDAVYWGGHKINGADPSTFEVMIDNRYWIGRDKNFCYSGPQKLECADITGDTYEFCQCSDKKMHK